ncbi:MAG: TlpA disulfide reductase family protein [Candidatus Pedobacter colombiensis]|uniref:TlpA disulfide reductase family protein n=1 Tax=Candidatus Pedobacter colombiensis TaxID=3121371 RepID=A0AAJ5W5W6_9SPHI|nr:TlpA disulfide reductase family protein [Pedobacter sp.]WEK18681.1 MAG: TlpA disulfide reductase family protein [Pedobacter sp.]
MTISSYTTVLIGALIVGSLIKPKASGQLQKQQFSFTIRGTIEGKNVVKNAIIYDRNHKTIGKVPIKDGSFKFTGMYPESNAEMTPAYYVLCSNQDSLERGDEGISKLIYLDPEVEVKFHSGTLKYEINGGAMNRLANAFQEQKTYFQKEYDSLVKVIQQQATQSVEGLSSAKIEELQTYYKFRSFSRTDSAYLSMIKANPSSPVSLDHFRGLVTTSSVSIKDARRIFEGLDSNIRASNAGKKMDEKIKKEEKISFVKYKYPPKLPLNANMYNFTVPDTKESLVQSKDVITQHKYTLIEFWSTYCIPCISEMPNLIEAKKMYKEKGFEVMTVSLDHQDDLGRWKGMVAALKMDSFVNTNDVGKRLGTSLNIKQIPVNYLVDSNGKIIAHNLRGSALEKKLAELLN